MLTAQFDRLSLDLAPEDAAFASLPGDQSERLDCLRTVHYIAQQLDDLKPDQVRAELSEHGAWSPADLSNHDTNLSRLLWLACETLTQEHQS